MKYDIHNKLILITGATSGIGRELAIECSQLRAKCILISRNTEKLRKIQNEIKEINSFCEIFPTDLNNEEEIIKTCKKILVKFPQGIDVLVNNAGIAHLGRVDQTPTSVYRENLEVNFYAPLVLIQQFIPAMKKRNSGQIINITSGVGKRGLPNVSPYCVSKFALNGLTESLRLELKSDNIDVISISPGLTKTSFFENMKVHGDIREKFLDGKFMSVHAVAKNIIKASQLRKREVTLTQRTRIVAILNAIFPQLIDKLLYKKYCAGEKL